MKLYLVFIATFLIVCSAFSDDSASRYLPASRIAFFNQLNSLVLEVVDENNVYFEESLGDYPWLARVIQIDFLKWDPSGKPKRQIEFCDPKIWQKTFLQPDIALNKWRENLEPYLKSCHSEWETMWTDALSNMVGMMSFKLNPGRYPYGRHVIFHLPNHMKLKGMLAMKTDGKKRPLIILRTGIFSNTQEFYPERSAFFQLFEQSPFNVLVLESSSGSEFLKHNRAYAIGGFDEGLQNFWLAQALQSPAEPISKYIQSVHMAGVSLGGHGVLFSALLNDINPGIDGKQVMQSALGICPLLNMQDTLDYHMSQGFSMDMMNYWASRRLKILKDRIPELKDSVFIPQFFNWMKRNYKGPLIAENGKIEGMRLPFEAETWLNEKKTPEELYWKLNHFWPWYQRVKTPVLILSTQKDPIVSWFINSGRMADGRMKLENSNIELYTFEQGFHCSLPIAYDWGAISTLLQTYFLKMSPGFVQDTKEVRLPLPAEVVAKFAGEKAPYLDLTFDVQELSPALFVKIRFDSEFWPSFQDKLLASRMSAQLPLSEMEFPIDGVVRNSSEASLLRRWAYQNVDARIAGKDIIFRWKVTR